MRMQLGSSRVPWANAREKASIKERQIIRGLDTVMTETTEQEIMREETTEAETMIVAEMIKEAAPMPLGINFSREISSSYTIKTRLI